MIRLTQFEHLSPPFFLLSSKTKSKLSGCWALIPVWSITSASYWMMMTWMWRLWWSHGTPTLRRITPIPISITNTNIEIIMHMMCYHYHSWCMAAMGCRVCVTRWKTPFSFNIITIPQTIITSVTLPCSMVMEVMPVRASSHNHTPGINIYCCRSNSTCAHTGTLRMPYRHKWTFVPFWHCMPIVSHWLL